MVNLILDDCMNVMKDYEDNYFDLAIVDPPYGIAQLTGMETSNNRGKLNQSRIFGKQSHKFKKWDNPPNEEYFIELFRVSKNQIIWGGNYFELPKYRHPIVWDKCQPWKNYSQVEIAWSSFNRPASIFKFDNRTGDKIHPTQKPIKLYEWLLSDYAEEGQKILDTHLGSGSIAVACHYFGVDLVGVEIDEEYYNSAKERINLLTKQETLF